MGILRRNRAFLLTAAVILAVGAVLFGAVVTVRVLAAAQPAQPSSLPVPASYNVVSSYGMVGYAPLKLDKDDPGLPAFISEPLQQERGIVLLVYVDGASDDMQMLESFDAIKKQYAADSRFLDFEARKSSELGDTLDQLKVSNPPILVVIRGTGDVAQMYTGWISKKVMSQVVANAVRGY